MKERHGRPSYSVKKKTYMTVWPEDEQAMLKLTITQQTEWVEAYPDTFMPAPNKRGQYGWTMVRMLDTDDRTFRYLTDLAWRNVAPKWLIPTRIPPPHVQTVA